MELESTAGADQASLKQTTEQPTQVSEMQHLADLLLEDESDAGASPTEQEQPTPLTKFNDLADKAGLDLDTLYKLEVSQAEDGSPVTVENLKDYYGKHGDVSLKEIEFEERRTQQESALLQAQEELRELMAAMPENAIKPEVLQKVRAKHEAQVALERQRTLEVIPDWQDAATRTADIEGMVAHLQQYGLPVDHLERVTDHRQLKYIRDNWQREQRIRKALDAVKAGRPNPTTKQKPAAKASQKNPLVGVSKGNARNKLEAVFSNLD